MHKKNIFFVILIIVLLLDLYSLKPILNSGYYFDDTLNSQTQAYLDYSGLTLSQHNQKIIGDWLYFGRIIPGAMYGYLPWLFIPLIKYKIILVSFHIIIMLTLSLFLYLLTKSSPFSFLFLLATPIFFQFRHSPDAITSFAILLPLIALKLSISLVFLQKYLNEKKRGFLIISLLFYLLMLLMFYEIAYLFFPLTIYLAYLKTKSLKKSIKISLPYIIFSLCFIVLYFFISARAPNHYSGSTINLDLRLIILAFLKQLSGSFPLTYHFLTQKREYFPFINKLDYLIGALYFAFSFVFLLKTKIKRVLPLIMIGLFITILPAIPISLSLRYQKEVAWGVGYLPVYIQYFGCALFLLGLILFFMNRAKNKILKIFIIGLFSAAMAFAVFINLNSNKIVIEDLNASFKYPRELIETALTQDLLSDVKEGETVISLNEGFWDTKENYYGFTGKKILVLPISQYFEKEKGSSNMVVKKESTDLYVLKYQTVNKDLGFAVLGKVKEIYYQPSVNINVVNVESAKIFIHNNTVYDNVKFIAYPSEYSSRKNHAEERILKLQDRGKFYDLRLENWLIDFASIKLVNSNNPSDLSVIIKNQYTDLPVDGYTVFWEGDFSGQEQFDNFTWHWSGKKGILKIVNLDEHDKTIFIDMAINTGFKEESALTVKDDDELLDVLRVNVDGLQYSKYIYLRSGLNYISLESDAKKAYTGPNDSRDLRFKIINFKSEIIN